MPKHTHVRTCRWLTVELTHVAQQHHQIKHATAQGLNRHHQHGLTAGADVLQWQGLQDCAGEGCRVDGCQVRPVACHAEGEVAQPAGRQAGCRKSGSWTMYKQPQPHQLNQQAPYMCTHTAVIIVSLALLPFQRPTSLLAVYVPSVAGPAAAAPTRCCCLCWVAKQRQRDNCDCAISPHAIDQTHVLRVCCSKTPGVSCTRCTSACSRSVGRWSQWL